MSPRPSEPKPPPRCALCAYELSGVDETAVCPECGGDVQARRSAGWRREDTIDDLDFITRCYIYAMIPAWLVFIPLTIGFISARAVNINHTNWSSSDHPWLEFVSSVLLLLSIPAGCCSPAILALPVVLACRWWIDRDDPQRMRRWILMILLVSVPYLLGMVDLVLPGSLWDWAKTWEFVTD